MAGTSRRRARRRLQGTPLHASRGCPGSTPAEDAPIPLGVEGSPDRLSCCSTVGSGAALHLAARCEVDAGNWAQWTGSLLPGKLFPGWILQARCYLRAASVRFVKPLVRKDPFLRHRIEKVKVNLA